MKIQETFSKDNNAYAGLTFEERTWEKKDYRSGKTLAAYRATVPTTWSTTATDIMADKYFRKAGVPSETVRVAEEGVPQWLQRSIPAENATFGGETDSRHVFHRLAGCWTYWGWIGGYFTDEESARAYYNDMQAMLANQIGAPNSPQWFNTGLYWSYGITGNAQGHYYVDYKTGELKRSEDAYSKPSPHACYIQSVNDDLVNEGGIFDFFTREARIFKHGAGSGSNFSDIRGANESLSGGGKSSGLMSFLKIGDRAAGAIKSGGTTRRAAKMCVLNADHPDIEEFVTWKAREEQKVVDLVIGSMTAQRCYNAILGAIHNKNIAENKRFDPTQNSDLKTALRDAKKAGIPGGSVMQIMDLAKQGTTSITIDTFDTGWESEAYASVSGQNSNNSVRLTDEFMEAVKSNFDWNLTARTTGKPVKTIKAGDLWDKIGIAAWQCADPGLQFDTTLNDWHTCASDGRINASNPCSEYHFLDDTSCNLASINVIKFLGETGNFDVKQFEKASVLWTLTLEISITMSQQPTAQIAQRTYNYRTLGLGYANIGSLLMRMGLAYDSDEGRNRAAAITALMTGTAYHTSAQMARELGAFKRYEANKDHMMRIMRNHHRAAHGKMSGYEKLSISPTVHQPNEKNRYLWNAARTQWNNAIELGELYGYRNAQTSLTAPTGTIGLLMDCDTTGGEPDFALVKFKTLSGGGFFKIVNQSVAPALHTLGYSAEEILAIETYATGTGKLSPGDRKKLAAMGVSEETMAALDKSLPGSMRLSDAATMHGITLGEGFTDQEIAEMSDRLCGTMTVEGAPGLKAKHLPVFDCATKCGLKGTRYISPMGHIDMMASTQPFLSGSISKTVNLPSSATINDVKETYWYSWTVGVKAIALYRDGSKLSQPLSGSSYDVDLDEGKEPQDMPSTASQAIKAAEAVLKMGQKRAMPKRAGGYRQKFSIGGHNVFIHTGEFEDGKLGEIFISMHKEGAAFRAMANNFAIAVSMGLQYGVPLEAFVDAFTFTRFEPNGPVVGHDNIKMSTSILDAIFRDLAISYLGQFDLANIKPTMDMDAIETKEKYDTSNGHGHGQGAMAPTQPKLKPQSTGAHLNGKSHAPMALTATMSSKDLQKAKGYTGDTCRKCGSDRIRRNMACTLCEDCGETSGCS